MKEPPMYAKVSGHKVKAKQDLHSSEYLPRSLLAAKGMVTFEWKKSRRHHHNQVIKVHITSNKAQWTP